MPLITALILVAAFSVIAGLLIRFMKSSKDEKLQMVAENLKTTLISQGMVYLENKKEEIKEITKNDISQEAIDIIFNEGVSKLMPYISPNRFTSSDFICCGRDSYVITDDTDHPFQITPIIAATAKKVIKGRNTDEEKAFAIYQWIERSIEYGFKKLDPKYRYRTAPEVFETKEGVCGEMAILYVVMARSVGLKSNFVIVRVDMNGNRVNHACASVNVNGINKLADPAYHRYNVSHLKYEIISDSGGVEFIKSFRKK